MQNSGECAVDPQLRPPRALRDAAPPRARHDRRRGHPHGAAAPRRPTVSGVPPLLGQDTVEVLTEVLGYDDERLGELFAAGALD